MINTLPASEVVRERMRERVNAHRMSGDAHRQSTGKSARFIDKKYMCACRFAGRVPVRDGK